MALIDWVRILVLIGGIISYIILVMAMRSSFRMMDREIPNDVNSDPKRSFNAGPVRSFYVVMLITVSMMMIAIVLLLASSGNLETVVGKVETVVGICLIVFSNIILAAAVGLAYATICFNRGWRIRFVPPLKEMFLERARTMRKRPVKSDTANFYPY